MEFMHGRRSAFFFHGALRPQKPQGLLGTGKVGGGRGGGEGGGSGTYESSLFRTAVETVVSEVHKLFRTGGVPISLTFLFWRWLHDGLVGLYGTKQLVYFANCCFNSCAEQTKSQKRCPKSNCRGTTLQQNKPSSSTSLLLVSPGLCSVQCCFTSTETIRLIRDGEPRTATSSFTGLLSFGVWCSVQCCLTSTET